MSKQDINEYLAGGFKRRDLRKEDDDLESDQDSDLDNGMYQEFWEEIKMPKRQATDRKSQSVARAATLGSARVSQRTTADGLRMGQAAGRNQFNERRGTGTLPSITQRTHTEVPQGEQLDEDDEGTTMHQNLVHPASRVQYGSITEEYEAKQAEFAVLRQAAKTKGVDTVRQDLEAVKNKVEVQRRTHAVELKHAKAYA